MKVSFEGIGEGIATFHFDGEGKAVGGKPVKMSGNGTVSPCGDGERFFGIALAGDEDFAAVQLEGFAELSFSGAAPGVGYVKLAADGSGGVKVSETGGEFLVVEVDAGSKVLGLVL